MSVRVMSLVWDNFNRGGSEKLAMLALADWCNDEGGSLHPSISDVAKKICVSESQARRIIHGFINEGYLTVVANHGGGNPGQSRHYKLNVEKLKTTCMDATPSTSATPCMDAKDPLHGCALPLAPMTPKPSLTINEPSIGNVVAIKSKPEKRKTSIPSYFHVTDELRQWASRTGINNIDAHLEPFILRCRANGYKYVDWHSAFQNAVRDDWARIGHGIQRQRKFVPA